MEITNESVIKGILEEQNRRAQESRDKMKAIKEGKSKGSTSPVAVSQGTITVGGKSLTRALASSNVDNMRMGNPENIVIGAPRTDWDPNKR